MKSLQSSNQFISNNHIHKNVSYFLCVHISNEKSVNIHCLITYPITVKSILLYLTAWYLYMFYLYSELSIN